MVHAQNKSGAKRQFTDKAWEMLPVGADGTKNGFTAISEQPISNKSKGPSMPSTGSSKKNSPIIEQKITNVANKDSNSNNVDSNSEVSTKTKLDLSEDAKTEFLKSAEGINTGVIKDYFDKNKIKYGKKDAPEVLYNALGEALNFDVLELQKIFS